MSGMRQKSALFPLSNAFNLESIGPALAEILHFEYIAEEVKVLDSADWIEHVKIYLVNRYP